MKKHSKTLVFACLGLSVAFSHANAGEIPFPQCPNKLIIKHEIQSFVNDEWETTNGKEEHALEGMYISFGDYSDKNTGHVKPSEEKRRKNGDLSIFWDIGDSSRHKGFNFWATCKYKNSSAILTRKLPENVSYCTVQVFKNGGPIAEEVKCFDTPRKTK
ncbi:MAG: hypothetical protein LBI92_00315 [Azoarcus sp.]|jgi:hypothetical protein|nr:hypothetical protein [Azoarcus sp.]